MNQLQLLFRNQLVNQLLSQRYHAIQLLFLIGIALIAAVPVVSAESMAVFAVFSASFLVFVLRAAPLVLLRSEMGIFHPVVFFSLLWLLRSVPSMLSDAYRVFAFGPSSIVLEHHDALVAHSEQDLNWLLASSIALTALGLGSYLAGYFFGPRFSLPAISFNDKPVAVVPICMMVGISAVIFYLYIQTQGGVSEHLLSWEHGRFAALEGDGIFLHAINIASIAALIWFSLSRSAVQRVLFWLLALCALGMQFIATGSRSAVIYWLCLAALIWMLRERTIAIGRFILVVCIALLLFGVLGSFRGTIAGEGEIEFERLVDIEGAFDKSFGVGDELGELSTRGGRQNGMLPILAAVPHEEPFLLGSSYLAVLTLPIPRALWSEKPRSIGALVNETFFDYDTAFSIPPGPVGEAYWNFYIPGVILVFGLFGIFHRSLYSWFQQHQQHRAAVLLYVVTLFILQEPSSLAATKWLFTFVPLLVLLRLFGYLKLTARTQ